MTEVQFVLLEDYADWEAAFLAAALQPLEDFTVKTVNKPSIQLAALKHCQIIP